MLLDQSAALNTIDHEILLHRLHHAFGYGETVLTWFQSYLESRTQIVTVHGKHLTPSSLRHGVPQGSVLGSELLLYTYSLYEMSSNITQFCIKCMQISHRSTNHLVNTIKWIEQCISNVKTWMFHNKLKMNDDKTEAILFARKRLATKHLQN